MAFALRIVAVVSAAVLAAGYVVFAHVNAPRPVAALSKPPVDSGGSAVGSAKMTLQNGASFVVPAATAIPEYMMTSSKSGPPIREAASILSSVTDPKGLFSWPATNPGTTGGNASAPGTAVITPVFVAPGSKSTVILPYLEKTLTPSNTPAPYAPPQPPKLQP